jgi:predicted SAM-dependent methyltransferase
MRNILLFLFSHHFLALARWEIYFLRLRLTNAIFGRNRRLYRFAKSRPQPRYLNFGSGPRGRDEPTWVNIDGFPAKGVHYCVDFQRPLPLPSGIFDGIFCEHVIEHFSYDDGVAVCRELYRCIGDSGVLRVIVPDAAFVMRSYFDSPNELVHRRGTSDDTPMQMVNSYFRQRYEHQFLYDWQTLEKMLSEAGFEDVRLCDFRVGFGPELLRIDDKKYEDESLYVEAQKTPAT